MVSVIWTDTTFSVYCRYAEFYWICIGSIFLSTIVKWKNSSNLGALRRSHHRIHSIGRAMPARWMPAPKRHAGKRQLMAWKWCNIWRTATSSRLNTNPVCLFISSQISLWEMHTMHCMHQAVHIPLGTRSHCVKGHKLRPGGEARMATGSWVQNVSQNHAVAQSLQLFGSKDITVLWDVYLKTILHFRGQVLNMLLRVPEKTSRLHGVSPSPALRSIFCLQDQAWERPEEELSKDTQTAGSCYKHKDDAVKLFGLSFQFNFLSAPSMRTFQFNMVRNFHNRTENHLSPESAHRSYSIHRRNLRGSTREARF